MKPFFAIFGIVVLVAVMADVATAQQPQQSAVLSMEPKTFLAALPGSTQVVIRAQTPIVFASGDQFSFNLDNIGDVTFHPVASTVTLHVGPSSLLSASDFNVLVTPSTLNVVISPLAEGKVLNPEETISIEVLVLARIDTPFSAGITYSGPVRVSILPISGDTIEFVGFALGTAGPAGPQGPQGVPGDIGAIGPQGPAGPQGAAGPQGPAGPMGPSGMQGPAGSNGPQGVPGPMGLVGPMGPAGPQGKAGAGLVSGAILTLPAVQVPPPGVTVLGTSTLIYLDSSNHVKTLQVKFYQMN